jgi:G8 domain-containing protein
MPRRPLLALALSLALAAASYVPYRLVTHRARGGPAPAPAAAAAADPAPAPRPAGPKVWRWSDPATWGGRAPKAGAAVTIPKSRRVLLDVSPPPLKSLKVEGGSASPTGACRCGPTGSWSTAGSPPARPSARCARG